MPGMDGWLARKYNIQEESADANAALARAQAGATESRSPFENALLNAQANQTQQQASTLRPLANASIAATTAGIGETHARSGLYGAETASTYDGLAPIGTLGAQGLYRGMQNFSGGDGGPNAGSSSPAASSAPQRSITDPTPTITAGGVGSLERSSFGDGSDPTNPYSTRFRRYASGTARVPIPAGPGPGQTITGGTWEPPPPPAPTPNQDLRAKMFGQLPRAFAKGTAKVSHGGGGHGKGKGSKPASPALMPPPNMMMPPGPPGGMPAPAQPMAAMPGGGPVAPPPGLPPGLAGMLQAAMGAAQVPGMPPPPGTPQDRVPAMLTPGEAVLTPGAAQAAGRGQIAALNAKHPPMASGPPRGAPRKPVGMNVKPNRPPVKPPGHTVNIHMKLGK